MKFTALSIYLGAAFTSKQDVFFRGIVPCIILAGLLVFFGWQFAQIIKAAKDFEFIDEDENEDAEDLLNPLR